MTKLHLILALSGALAATAGCSDKRDDPPPPPAPVAGITSVSPFSGPDTGATALTVNGTAFGTGTTVTVQGTLATNIVIVSSGQLTCDTRWPLLGAVENEVIV